MTILGETVPLCSEKWEFRMRTRASRGRMPPGAPANRVSSSGLGDRHEKAWLGSLCAALLLAGSASTAKAAEGGFSFYLPGTAGDIALAQSAEPGDLQLANTVYFQQGNVDAAVLQGNVNLGVDLDLVLDVVSAGYTFERKVLGAAYSVGAAIPFGRASLEAEVERAGGGFRSANGDSADIGDIAVVPLELTWRFGDYLSVQFGQAIFVPTGGYDDDKVVNIGLNRWGFDTTLSTTYFNLETGTELSLAPGILFNTENNDTDYDTGTEFHIDVTVNQFLSETFALGLRGYYYNQISDDSGGRLGGFQGESGGLGPGFVWFPKSGGGDIAILGKWIHDIDATRRFESDYVTLTGALTF